MQPVNLPTVVVTAAGNVILDQATAVAATKAGVDTLIINPSVDIVLVDPTDGGWAQQIPGAVAGSVANSPITCPANTPTLISHRGGMVKGISTGADSTVKRALGVS